MKNYSNLVQKVYAFGQNLKAYNINNCNNKNAFIVRKNITHLRKNITHLRKNITHLRKNITHLRKNITHLRKNITHLRKINSLHRPAPRAITDLFTCTKYYKYYKVLKNRFTIEIFIPIENLLFINLQIKKGVIK
ncbi:hypothetical protein [Sulfurimonas sp.]|uniref:hypothetical protein n=1 Tax=Sulfurimonas sp. TaxID=2022749 RepID=UPI0025D2E0D2|nr:hypothetical protein [Sulfurimonas sp.]MBW6487573.1 hypothetical protein [Sulfurimonas sp.]